MPLPVIADVFKLDLVWFNANAPRQAINTLYYKDTAGGQTAANLATDFNAAALGNQWLVVTSASSIIKVRATPLDGTTAGSEFATPGGARFQGGAAGDAILQGAAVISFKSATRGPKGRNRIFLPWIAESQQSNGVVDPTNLGFMTTAWGTFGASMVAAGWEQHAVSGVHGNSHPVINTILRSSLYTQRRRARR